MTPPGLRPAWAEVDLGAIRHNASEVGRVTAAQRVCAVVKADGYGHGAVPVAKAAIEGGATWLAVALVEEAAALRGAGIDGPMLVLSEPPPDAMGVAAGLDLRVTVYTARGIEAAAAAGDLLVHLKVDTGMHRVGAQPAEVSALAERIARAPGLQLEAVWTHLAVADEPDRPQETARQLERFDEAVAALRKAGLDWSFEHVSNSAGALMVGATYGMVRAGIALYGYHPNPDAPSSADLRPAMSLKAHVSHVKRLDAGEAMSYGLRYRLASPATIATVPLGYADGVPRRLGAVGGEFLVAGEPRPIAGTVTMDQTLVDCGDLDVSAGDEVVLIGRQGAAQVTADDWARRLDTISYEILCGIGPRVPRVHAG
ncbi:MAG TPA: alanine racemase [Acidimicrobiales bacterium]